MNNKHNTLSDVSVRHNRLISAEIAEHQQVEWLYINSCCRELGGNVNQNICDNRLAGNGSF